MGADGPTLLRPLGTREGVGAARGPSVTHPSPPVSPSETSLLADRGHLGRGLSGNTSLRCVGAGKHGGTVNQSEESRALNGGKNSQSFSGPSPQGEEPVRGPLPLVPLPGAKEVRKQPNVLTEFGRERRGPESQSSNQRPGVAQFRQLWPRS